MSDSKDVLAFFGVLQGLPSMVTTMRGETFTSFDVRQARAAVAELIEKGQAVERRLIPLLSGKLQDVDHAEFVAFFAALAACTPAKEGVRNAQITDSTQGE